MALWSKLFGAGQKHTNDAPELIQKNIADGKALMLDVRSQEEWNNGYLKYAVLIAITELRSLPPATAELAELDKSKIIYCH